MKSHFQAVIDVCAFTNLKSAVCVAHLQIDVKNGPMAKARETKKDIKEEEK